MERAAHCHLELRQRCPLLAARAVEGASLLVVFAAEQPLEGELSLKAPDGSVAVESCERRGGSPYFDFNSPARARPSLGGRGKRIYGNIARDYPTASRF